MAVSLPFKFGVLAKPPGTPRLRGREFIEKKSARCKTVKYNREWKQ